MKKGDNVSSLPTATTTTTFCRRHTCTQQKSVIQQEWNRNQQVKPRFTPSLCYLLESHVCNPPTFPRSDALRAAPGSRLMTPGRSQKAMGYHQFSNWLLATLHLVTSYLCSLCPRDHYHFHGICSVLGQHFTIILHSVWIFPDHRNCLSSNSCSLQRLHYFFVTSLFCFKNQRVPMFFLNLPSKFCWASNVTKPKPLHRPVSRSVMTTTSVIVPQVAVCETTKERENRVWDSNELLEVDI